MAVQVDGLLVSDWQKFTENWAQNMLGAPEHELITQLEDQQGFTCVFQKTRVPVPLVSDRCMFQTYYRLD